MTVQRLEHVEKLPGMRFIRLFKTHARIFEKVKRTSRFILCCLEENRLCGALASIMKPKFYWYVLVD